MLAILVFPEDMHEYLFKRFTQQLCACFIPCPSLFAIASWSDSQTCVLMMLTISMPSTGALQQAHMRHAHDLLRMQCSTLHARQLTKTISEQVHAKWLTRTTDSSPQT